MLELKQPKSINSISCRLSGGKYITKFVTNFTFSILIAKKVVIEGCKHANAMSFTEIGKSKEIPNINAGMTTEVIKITE